jgi:hypothetical protein
MDRTGAYHGGGPTCLCKEHQHGARFSERIDGYRKGRNGSQGVDDVGQRSAVISSYTKNKRVKLRYLSGQSLSDSMGRNV